MSDYQDTWQLVDRMIKAQRRRQEPDTGSGWAAAVGLLNVYLVEAIQDLSPRQREVIECRYGLGDRPVHSLAETAATLGVTRERVRQIQMEALERLRRYCAAEGLLREGLGDP